VSGFFLPFCVEPILKAKFTMICEGKSGKVRAMVEAQWLSDVYSTVDEACVGDGALPPGAIGRLARLADAVRTSPAEQHYIKRVDDMLVAMHRLRSAMSDKSIRAELRTMRDEWIKTAPMC